MQENDSAFRAQTFGDESDGLITVHLQSQQEAVQHLQAVLADTSSVRLLHGPTSSGKTSIVRRFVEELSADTSIAVIDGAELMPENLMSAVLAEFGYRVDLPSVDDYLKMVRMIAIQQTRASHVPVIAVENIERMYPGSLRALCMLATLTYKGQFITRLVLTGNERSLELLKSDGMSPIAQRHIATFAVTPLSSRETLRYLHGRLQAAGVVRPDSILPLNVCDQLHEMSGGWPGLLNKHTLKALSRSSKLPVSIADVTGVKQKPKSRPAPPELIVSDNGKVVGRYPFKERKIAVGRSELADIVINDTYASKFHSMFILYRDALVLVDLNSSNGTLVNSVRVKSAILQSNDIISISNHRIKVLNAPKIVKRDDNRHVAADTARMKTIEDMRRARQKGLMRLVDDVGNAE